MYVHACTDARSRLGIYITVSKYSGHFLCNHYYLLLQDLLVNLTQELEGIALISPERILNINSTLTSFEEDAASNQILVNSLTVEVRQLQESADELRLRYTQVQQHRDLLQDILRNVEDLNCREQFEN